MKQTAVEWLVSELKKYDSAGLKDQSNYVIEMPTHILTELEEQAKEIEKQQQGYSEEDMKLSYEAGKKRGNSGYSNTDNFRQPNFEEFIEQFKNKKQ